MITVNSPGPSPGGYPPEQPFSTPQWNLTEALKQTENLHHSLIAVSEGLK